MRSNGVRAVGAPIKPVHEVVEEHSGFTEDDPGAEGLAEALRCCDDVPVCVRRIKMGRAFGCPIVRGCPPLAAADGCRLTDLLALGTRIIFR